MGNERTHSFQQKSFHTPQPTTQFGSRPFPAPVQMKPKEQQTPDELENEAFNQNKFEAFGLQLKEKSGTITPVEQEQLGLLQAKMDDFWAQRRERASRFSYDFSKVSVTPPGEPAAPQIQPMSRQESETPNQTGLPDNLKAGVENLSGYSLDNVRVHYNSPKPEQLQALAYTQGTEIHVAPGQEEHLPHEAWHFIQQMQGRVKPTIQMKGVEINDDEGLEREADVIGTKALGSAVLGEFDKGKINADQSSALQLKSAVIQLQPKPNVRGSSQDSTRLKNIVNALFKGAPSGGVAIGDGSALAACSYEKKGGARVGGADHQAKCAQLLNAVDKLIARTTNPQVIQAGNQLSAGDLAIATKLKADLQDALAGNYAG